MNFSRSLTDLFKTGRQMRKTVRLAAADSRLLPDVHSLRDVPSSKETQQMHHAAIMSEDSLMLRELLLRIPSEAGSSETIMLHLHAPSIPMRKSQKQHQVKKAFRIWRKRRRRQKKLRKRKTAEFIQKNHKNRGFGMPCTDHGRWRICRHSYRDRS